MTLYSITRMTEVWVIMKRVLLNLLLVCMLILGFVFTPVISEPRNSTSSRLASSRANLIVGAGQAYTTISAAVTAATSGDTIYVYAGTYNEEIILNKRLSLIGNGTAVTIIDSLGSNVPVDIRTNYCTLSGFTIKGSGGAATDAGVLINSSFNHILECNISNNQGNGLRIESAGGNSTIDDCMISYNSRNGIKIISSDFNLIKNCTIIFNDENGINLQNTNGNTFENNTISDSLGAGKSSIAISSGNDNIIKFNDLLNEQLCIDLWGCE
jgi:parallel beta-helix repeat protein